MDNGGEGGVTVRDRVFPLVADDDDDEEESFVGLSGIFEEGCCVAEVSATAPAAGNEGVASVVVSGAICDECLDDFPFEDRASGSEMMSTPDGSTISMNRRSFFFAEPTSM